MTSKKKLVKKALKHPELHTPAELTFFKLWLESRKKQKEKADDETRSPEGRSSS